MSAGLSHSDLYDIPQDLLDFRDLVRRLAQEQIAPRAAEIDRAAEYPWDVRRLLAEQDVLVPAFRDRVRRHRHRDADAPDGGRGDRQGVRVAAR